MKKITFYLLILLLSACYNPELEAPLSTEQAMMQKAMSTTFSGIEIPVGANSYFVGEELKIELPEGYQYVGVNQQGLAIASGTVGVRCNCTSGTGCSANKTTDKKGSVSYTCIMQTDCSTCTKKETAMVDGVEQIVEIQGLINLNLGITFLTDQDLSDLPSSNLIDVEAHFVAAEKVRGTAFPALLELPAFKAWEADIAAWFTPELTAADLEKYYLNVFGNKMVVSLPAGFEITIGDTVLQPLSYTGTTGTDKVECVCHAGDGCNYQKKKVPFGSTYEFCEAKDCTDCELKD